MEQNTYSFTVIGGADGPTSIFLAGKIGDGFTIGIIVFIVLIVILAIYLFRRRK